ncbi:MAG: hypothetical protein B6245_01165 [Desulfobacteraceae bacterium 4572_88]|nr:MAG: hypothetical protein B6245_01165 [Desulfobacteraceae bacterium 4572_88]
MNKNSRKILIADDEPDNIRILAEALTGDYKIIAATSGGEAIECAVCPNPPDLILLDIMMPDMDGYAVLERLRADGKTRHIPVIIITALNRDVDEIRGFDMGAVDYVTKPFSPAVINARVRTHLELRDSMQAIKEANTQLHREIAERHKIQEELRKSYSLLHSTIESVAEAIMVIDKKGNLLTINRKFVQMWYLTEKWSAENDNRKRFDMLLERVRDPETFARRFEDLLNAPETDDYDTFEMRDGRIIEFYARPYKIGDIITGQIYTYMDVTERVRMQEELQESERRYRAVVEDQTELICCFRPDRTLTFVNDAYCRYFGRTREELIGHSFMMFMSPVDRKKMEEHLASLNRENPVAGIEHQVLNADADIRWLRRTDRAIFDDQGHITELQSVVWDTTDRKLAENSLKDATMEKETSRIKLEAVFRSIPEGIVTVDTRGQILRTNESLRKICALASHMNSGKFSDQLMEECHCIHALRKLLKNGRTVSEHRIQCDAGDSGNRNLNLTTLPLLDHNKKSMGAMLVIRDVTRLVELETRLGERSSFGGIIGRSEPMQRIYSLLEQFADTEISVLITGETGTGKERIMESLHFGSSRSEKPLVRVNCAMLAENLIESELFGHIRGAFTSADRDKVGRFEMARGGTLFLDEIGEIAPHLQAKLLRVLEYKEFERVGESRLQKADVRIIAASNVNMAEQVRQGRFREDLYYRLKVFCIQLPPLRERIGDIPLLAKHFMELGAKNMGKHFTGLSDEVLSVFAHYPWPGNVRELKNAIEYACVLCPGHMINIEHLPPEMLTPPEKNFLSRMSSVPMSEKEAVLDALKRTKWNKTKAARILGISRGTFYNRLLKYGIDTE